MSLPVVQLCLIIPFLKNKNQHRKHSPLCFWCRKRVLQFPRALINIRPSLQWVQHVTLSLALGSVLCSPFPSRFLRVRVSPVRGAGQATASRHSRIMGIFPPLIPRGHRLVSHARTSGSCCHEQVDGLKHKRCLQSKAWVFVTYLKSGSFSC